MNTKYFFILVVAAFISCNAQPTGPQTSSNGFEYEIFPGESAGETVADSSYAVFNLFLYDDKGELLQSTIQNEMPPTLMITRPIESEPKMAPIQEVVAKMNVGDSATIKYPIDSMPTPDPRFAESEYLLYAIDLFKAKSQEEFQEERDSIRAETARKAAELQSRIPAIEALVKQTYADHTAGKIDWQETPEGLKYIIHEKGTGPQAEAGDRISAHYYGFLKDGSKFQSSFDRGIPFSFTLGNREAIQGWDIGFQQFTEGTKATLNIPAELAYGERGSPPAIGPNENLFFYVELEKVAK